MRGRKVLLQYCSTPYAKLSTHLSDFLMDIAELLKRLQNLDAFSFPECQYIVLHIAFI